MRVLVLDSRKVVYEGDARRVVLPGEDGQVCILDFHQAYLCCLRAGDIQIQKRMYLRETANKAASALSSTRITIKKGLAKIINNEVVVLIET